MAGFNQSDIIPYASRTTTKHLGVEAPERAHSIWRFPLAVFAVTFPLGCIALLLAREPGGVLVGQIGEGLLFVAALAIALGLFLQYRSQKHHDRLDAYEEEQREIEIAINREKLEHLKQARQRIAAIVKIEEDGGVEITNYYPHPKVQITEEKPAAAALASPLQLPGFMLMQDVMRKWDLNPQNLFLGYGKGSQALACTLDGYLHVAHDAPTGGGKTALFYAELIQMIKIGVRVILANPHFAPIGKKGDDWRPIAQAIEAQGLIELAPGVQVPGLMRGYQVIYNMLRWLSTSEIDRRFDMLARGDYSFTPLYIFIDEWIAVVSRFPDAAGYLADVLQRGRAVEVCVVNNAQGYLVKDVQLQGSARENFQTAYHMGGSPHSASALLDMPVRDLNALMSAEKVTLGKGIALLRNNEASPTAQLVRLPLANNEYCYYMLGRADGWQLPEFRRGNGAETVRNAETFPSASGAVSAVSEDVIDTSTVSEETRKRIHYLREVEHWSHRDIAREVRLIGRSYGIYRAVCKEENIRED